MFRKTVFNNVKKIKPFLQFYYIMQVELGNIKLVDVSVSFYYSINRVVHLDIPTLLYTILHLSNYYYNIAPWIRVHY